MKEICFIIIFILLLALVMCELINHIKKRWITRIIILIILILLIVFNSTQKDKSYIEYANENQISVELIEATAEYTHKDPYDIAVIFNNAAENGLDLYEGITMVAPELSKEEILSIINTSDEKQEE